MEDEIANGTFRPGDHLDEQVLAARFGVSRTPIREVLMQLSASGLVEARPRRGMVVATLGAEQLIEMFEVMAEMEGMAGRLAARRCTEEDEAQIRATHETCRRAAESTDADAYYYENEQFHEAIYTASHNAFLHEACSSLHRRLKPYRRLQLRVPNRVATSFREHDGIVAAIVARDPERAQLLLRQHVLVQGDRFADLIASLRQLQQQPAAASQRG